MQWRRRRRGYYSRDADSNDDPRAETSDTTQPEDINDLDFSHLDAGPNAFDDLLK
jgi:hypothetical protein